MTLCVLTCPCREAENRHKRPPTFLRAGRQSRPSPLFSNWVAARVRAFLLAAGRSNRPSPPCDSYSETLSQHSSILVAQALQTEHSRILPQLHDFRHSDSKAMTQAQNPRPDRTARGFFCQQRLSLCHSPEAFEAPRALATMMGNVDIYWPKRRLEKLARCL